MLKQSPLHPFTVLQQLKMPSYISKWFAYLLETKKEGVSYTIGADGRLKVTIAKSLYGAPTTYKDEANGTELLFFGCQNDSFWVSAEVRGVQEYKISHILQHGPTTKPGDCPSDKLVKELFKDVTDDESIDVYIV